MNFAYRILLGIVVAFSMSASGQTSYPMVMSVQPVATQVGVTSQHTINSRYDMSGAYEILVSGNGVSATVVPLEEPKAGEKAKKPVPTQLQVSFDVDEDAMPGIREYRVATPRGISTLGQIVIVTNPIAIESSKNNTIDEATEVTLPATICGAIEKAEDVDFFRFQAKKDQTLFFHVRSMRLQDKIHDLQIHSDPLITLRSANGSTLAAADNSFRGDPFIGHQFDADGEYLLEIRDARYLGNKYWEYAIDVAESPFVKMAFPIAVAPKQLTPLQLYGFNIPDGKAAVRVEDAIAAVGDHRPQLGDQPTNPIKMMVFDQALVRESEDDNNTIETAQTVPIPSGINGRIESTNDVDYYAFDAKKDEKYTFEVIARRLGSALDSHLRIVDEKGTQQQLNDDFRLGKRNQSDSLIENWTARADGKYFVEIRDLHLRGAEDFVYFIRTEKAKPYFELYADTDKTQLTPTTGGVVYVRIVKKNGFDQPVQLHVDELPKGITATCGKIQDGKSQDGCIIFHAATDAKPITSNIRIWGEAIGDESDSETKRIAEASIYQEIYQPGGGRGHWPSSSHMIAIGEPSDIRSIKLSTNQLLLKPGASTKIDIAIERADGFDKNVTLDISMNHLNSIYGNPLPEGVTLDKANSKVLLTKGETQGHITLKADEKAQPVEGQQIAVIANIAINFVMKATYSSEPVTVTVQKP